MHMDIVYKRLKDRLWCCQGAHAWHPVLQQMLTIATMDLEVASEKTLPPQLLFWELLQKAVKDYADSIKSNRVMKCDPRFFVFDGQGSFWTGSLHKKRVCTW